MNITRTGKIARLPHAIRDRLNQRLQDGEKARSLVAWLNSSPEVQAILAADFGAKPIRPQNLSEWRHGGYRDWLHHQQALEFARSFTEEARELQASAKSPSPGLPAIAPLATAGPPSVVLLTKEAERRPPVPPPLTQLLSVWLATRYTLLTRTLDPADPEHWRRLREICADVVKLRQGDHAAERLRLDRQRRAAHVQHGETGESDRIRLNPTFESNLNSPPPAAPQAPACRAEAAGEGGPEFLPEELAHVPSIRSTNPWAA
jgi:hypothetical protein